MRVWSTEPTRLMTSWSKLNLLSMQEIVILIFQLNEMFYPMTSSNVNKTNENYF